MKTEIFSRIYNRGYILSKETIDLSQELKDLNFVHEKVFGLNLYTKQDCKWYSTSNANRQVILIGHAYNPFSLVWDEQAIIEELVKSSTLQRSIDELTGIFLLIIIENGCIHVYQDACGMMPCYYGKVNSNSIITNFVESISYLLTRSEWIDKYVNAKFYKIGIRQLPGIESPYEEMKMLTANTYLDFENMSVTRFFPLSELQSVEDFPAQDKKIAGILHNSMECCANKWDKPSISMTGGCDSRLTLGAAVGLYDKFKYFSFISNPAENKDCIAAEKIAKNIGVQHKTIAIPTTNEELNDFADWQELVEHNGGYILKHVDAEIRKIATLTAKMESDVEIKSHINEVGRAFYYKKLDKKHFSYPLSPRAMSNLAKRNMFDRGILKKMDLAFQLFIDVTHFYEMPKSYDQTDMFYWENRMPLWAALVKQSFDVSHETTIIYNNRLLLESFLVYPLEDRIKDIPQKRIIDMLNPILTKQESNENAMEGWKRKLMEKVFFNLNRL